MGLEGLPVQERLCARRSLSLSTAFNTHTKPAKEVHQGVFSCPEFVRWGHHTKSQKGTPKPKNARTAPKNFLNTSRRLLVITQ